MEKGYYIVARAAVIDSVPVAIHNKNGKGLLLKLYFFNTPVKEMVAIHNKNGKGLLPWDLL